MPTDIKCAKKDCKFAKDGKCQKQIVFLDEGKYEGDAELKCLDYDRINIIIWV